METELKDLNNCEISKFRRIDAELSVIGVSGNGKNGLFRVPFAAVGKRIEPWMPIDYGLLVLISSGCGWDHVSVYLQNRCPTWDEMELIRKMVAEPHETWVQFGVPEKDHISYHPYVLHWWRDQHRGHRLPPSEMVGPKK